MFTSILAAHLEELPATFGLHTEAFIAHLLAFIIIVSVVVFFGIKPVMKQLEERRARIVEGEAMHARSQKELAEVRRQGEGIVEEAREQAKAELAHAREVAAGLREDLTAKAGEEAQAIIQNARHQAEMDARRQEDELRSKFAELIAQATAQVTGKVLTEADHRAINAEAINHLP